MKISFLLIMVTVLNAYATSIFSQNTTMSVDMQNVTVREIVGEIEKQGTISFLFNDNLAGLNRRVNVSFTEQPIRDVLESALSQADMTYEEIKDNFVVLLSKPEYLEAQAITITGRVIDADTQDPLPGVSIVLQGTTVGTVTNADGNYSLSNVPPNGTLVFSFVGMTTRIFPVDGRSSINIALEAEAIGIAEVVAIGYGTRVAGDITGAVSTLRSEQLQTITATSAGEVLRGNVSGITTTTANTPGGGAMVRVRGLGTINDNDPLWVVDGVPGGTVHPDNIESITVLKDAASQAIYGARAANGVILVTTKTGRIGQPLQIDVSVRRGFKRNIWQPDMLNAQEYGEMLWIMAENDGIENYSHVQYGSGPTPVVPNYIKPAGATTVDYSLYDDRFVHEDGTDTFIIMESSEGTNWIKEVTQDAPYQEYRVGLTGGSENTTYAFQLGYLDQDGVFIHSSYDRYNLQSNINSNPTNWLTIGQRVGLTYQTETGSYHDYSMSSPVQLSLRIPTIIPVHDVMGNYAGTRAPDTGTASNPVFSRYAGQNDTRKEFITTGNVFIEANILEGLTFKTIAGVNYRSRDAVSYEIPARARAQRNLYASTGVSNRFILQWNWTNTLQYNTTFEDHNLTLIVGSEAINNTNSFSSAARTGYFSENPQYMVLDAGEFNQVNSGSKSEWGLFSVFSRANYSYKERYFLELVARRDGSSRFGPDMRYNIFPAMSAGWRISNEDFMRAATETWLDYLMLRLGYGQTGNDQVGNYNAYTTFASSMHRSFYPITGHDLTVGNAGFITSTIGNPKVAWEATTTVNLGLSANFLQSWSLSFDVWRRNTKDMLYQQRIPDVMGQATAPSINIGEMDNTGFDIELGYRGVALNRDLRYTISMNVSRYVNEIVGLSDVVEEALLGGRLETDYFTLAKTGTPFPVFYGFIIDGIFQTEAEAASHPPAFGGYNQVGRWKFRDVNGDGVVNEDDRTIIGDPHPNFTAGLNLDVSYKGFTISTRLYGVYGNDVMNTMKWFTDFASPTNSRKRLYESWGSPYLDDNSNATLPIARFSDATDRLPSTYFVEDGSFLRMQNLQLSYNMTGFLGLNYREISVYGNISNVFTITNYTGPEPEVHRSGMNLGLDFAGWPTPRQFMLGIQIGI